MFENFNWYGCYTIYKKENRGFYAKYNQTIIGPIVSSLTFFAVLMLSIGQKNTINILPTKDFIVCGIVMQALMQSSFGHTSYSIIIAKVVGYIYDILFPPLSSNGILIAYLCSALTRAVIVGMILLLGLLPFTQIQIWNVHFWWVLYFSISASSILALLGTITGIIANNFEQVGAISKYTILPLSSLSCMFYSVKSLPEIVQKITLFNPFFYLMDGFRYSLTGYSECSKALGIIVPLVSTILLLLITKMLLDSGYGIKK
jgi:ABC-2 type transport system permease protein